MALTDSWYKSYFKSNKQFHYVYGHINRSLFMMLYTVYTLHKSMHLKQVNGGVCALYSHDVTGERAATSCR